MCPSRAWTIRIEEKGGRVVFDGYYNYRVFAKAGMYPGELAPAYTWPHGLGFLALAHPANVFVGVGTSGTEMTN